MNNSEIENLASLHSNLIKNGNLDPFLSKPIEEIKHNLHNIGKTNDLIRNTDYLKYDGAFTKNTAEIQDIVNEYRQKEYHKIRGVWEDPFKDKKDGQNKQMMLDIDQITQKK